MAIELRVDCLGEITHQSLVSTTEEVLLKMTGTHQRVSMFSRTETSARTVDFEHLTEIDPPRPRILGELDHSLYGVRSLMAIVDLLFSAQSNQIVIGAARDAASKVLMIAVAAAAAQLSSKEVLDDDHILGTSDRYEVDELLAYLSSPATSVHAAIEGILAKTNLAP